MSETPKVIEPVMELGTLRQLLGIVKDQRCDWIQWQPMPDFDTGHRFEVQTLSARELCARAFEVVAKVWDWREAKMKAEREADEWKKSNQRRAERIAYLENWIHDHGDDPDEI